MSPSLPVFLTSLTYMSANWTPCGDCPRDFTLRHLPIHSFLSPIQGQAHSLNVPFFATFVSQLPFVFMLLSFCCLLSYPYLYFCFSLPLPPSLSLSRLLSLSLKLPSCFISFYLQSEIVRPWLVKFLCFQVKSCVLLSNYGLQPSFVRGNDRFPLSNLKIFHRTKSKIIKKIKISFAEQNLIFP